MRYNNVICLPVTRANENYFRCLLVVRAKACLGHQVTEVAGVKVSFSSCK